MVLGAGMTLLAVALVTPTGHGRMTAAPPAKRPATTAPGTAPTATPTPTRTAKPRTIAAPPTVFAADAPRSDTSGTKRPAAGAPSGPEPHPTATRQARCNVSVTSAALAACLKLGIRIG
jgi:hypothetical protein